MLLYPRCKITNATLSRAESCPCREPFIVNRGVFGSSIIWKSLVGQENCIIESVMRSLEEVISGRVLFLGQCVWVDILCLASAATDEDLRVKGFRVDVVEVGCVRGVFWWVEMVGACAATDEDLRFTLRFSGDDVVAGCVNGVCGVLDLVNDGWVTDLRGGLDFFGVLGCIVSQLSIG